MSRTYRDRGIILQKYELGEADILATVFLQDSGMTRMVAKGVRKMTSRKRGHVELFNTVDVLIAKGHNLDVLVEATAIDTFEGWRGDLTTVSLAYYAADITLMLVPEEELQVVVFDQMVQLFAWLGRARHPDALIRWYEVQLLSSLGYWAPNQLISQSQNAVELLERCVDLSAQQMASLRLAPRLLQEMEHLMSQQLVAVIERQTKTQRFVDQVRELDSI
jgi:recombinational DNA repair protein (RecF pathway)